MSSETSPASLGRVRAAWAAVAGSSPPPEIDLELRRMAEAVGAGSFSDEEVRLAVAALSSIVRPPTST